MKRFDFFKFIHSFIWAKPVLSFLYGEEKNAFTEKYQKTYQRGKGSHQARSFGFRRAEKIN